MFNGRRRESQQESNADGKAENEGLYSKTNYSSLISPAALEVGLLMTCVNTMRSSGSIQFIGTVFRQITSETIEIISYLSEETCVQKGFDSATDRRTRREGVQGGVHDEDEVSNRLAFGLDEISETRVYATDLADETSLQADAKKAAKARYASDITRQSSPNPRNRVLKNATTKRSRSPLMQKALAIYFKRRSSGIGTLSW